MDGTIGIFIILDIYMEESLLPAIKTPLAEVAGSIAAIQLQLALHKIKRLVFTAEQHLNQLKIFAEIGLPEHQSPSAA